MDKVMKAKELIFWVVLGVIWISFIVILIRNYLYDI